MPSASAAASASRNSSNAVRALTSVACHAAKPVQPGFLEAPLGIVLETPQQIAAQAERIAVTVQTRYMPIGNLTGMTDEERVTVAGWYAQKTQ